MFRKFLSLLLIVSIITPLFYLPQQAPKAEAFLGFGDITVDIKALVDRIADGFAMTIAQTMVDHMVQSTVKWAQSGFDGGPAYATDPKQYFTDLADGAAGEFIKGDQFLGALCTPFQANIRISLASSYYESQPFQCTLSKVVDNIEDYYKDFNKGGWEAWFSMTQNSSNNPYGAYLEAKIQLDSRVAAVVGAKKQELDWSSGFLSYEKCLGTEVMNNETKKKECVGKTQTVTPGSTIKNQLDKVLPSGLEKLITAQHLDQLVSSFASGLLTRYVFGPKGLFAGGSSGTGNTGTSSGGNRTGMVDLDGDGIPDGQDSDYDGKLDSTTDTCLHGGDAPRCLLSAGLTSSPYFAPVCEAITQGVATLTEYAKFLNSHSSQVSGDNFNNKADADIWATRTSEANSAVDQILSSIQSRNSSYFDEIETATNRFSNYLGKVLESLIKDKDLDLAGITGNGGGGADKLKKQVAADLQYFQTVKTQIGKCEKPNISAIPNIPLPPDIDMGGGGGQCLATGNQYEGALRDAMDEVLAERPDVANLPNIESGGRQNARIFLALVRDKLISKGYSATTDVLNGNNNPNSGDAIAVWRSGDTTMERYDAITGEPTSGPRPIKDSISNEFTGFIPLSCTTAGGGKDCGCKNSTGPGDGGGTIVPDVPSLFDDVRAEREKYGAIITQEEAGKILNAVAWKNRADGWGLSRKTSGTPCPSPVGTIACDILQYRSNNVMVDVFIDSPGPGAGSKSTPTWSPDSVQTDSSRPWIAPAQP